MTTTNPADRGARMPTESFEYAVKKDVKNNPIVREVDRERHRDMFRSIGFGACLVIVVLFWAWQHFELLRHGYRFEQMQQELVAEQETNRHLRLETETLAAPERIEREARRIGLSAPMPADTVVVERVLQAAPLPKSVVASR
jgi:cell division protein FtsL